MHISSDILYKIGWLTVQYNYVLHIALQELRRNIDNSSNSQMPSPELALMGELGNSYEECFAKNDIGTAALGGEEGYNVNHELRQPIC